MKLFTKKETFLVVIVLFFIGFFSFFNLKAANRRARDFQRKDDIANIANALFEYHEAFGFYPKNSPDGRIVACLPPTAVDYQTAAEAVKAYRPCDWWFDGLSDPITGAVYLKQIPGDPYTGDGVYYRYVATRDNFQVFASLEGGDEPEYDEGIEARQLICGTAICNFGKGSPNTPLDKSLEEYENELRKNDEQ